MQIRELLQSNRGQFWSLQLIGWGGWGLTWYTSRVFWGNIPDTYHFYILTVATVGMVISLGMRAVYRATWEWSLGRRALIILAASWLAAALWMIARHFIFRTYLGDDPGSDGGKEGWDVFFAMIDGIITHWFVMLCWSGLYVGIKYYKLLQAERERSIRVESMAHEAQLKMLRYQLNPHFLFNTLNAISTLILDGDARLANTMVTRLSSFLRYSLDNDPMQKISLAQEMEALQLYLDIEKVRFDERLQVDFDLEKGCETALIPSLLLQPLVENSIKYAISQSVNGGRISIRARVFGGELLLEVGDDGPGSEIVDGELPPGTGVGLANTRDRLRELYGKDHSFKLCPSEPRGLTVSIRLPLEREGTA
jgi:two-component sensor histidine kinase